VIFVTVGGQIPFDRLIREVDTWAGARGDVDVFAQIGATELRPRNIEWTGFLGPEEFRGRVQSARALVAHAGMGSILTALEFGKPILVLPRRADLRETRTDHQFATARHFQQRGFVDAVFEERDLWGHLDGLEAAPDREPISDSASPTLIETLRAFIDEA
jgi:UDP-N-acetylglucosamine transferase subunit ALG13